MNRRQARQVALKALYQLDIGGAQIRDALRYSMEEFSDDPPVDVPKDDPGLAFASMLAENSWRLSADLDEKIKPMLKGWTIDRLPRVDLEILRMGIYEMENTPTPKNAIINECVELAKEFSTADSGRFINGVLGLVARTLEGLDTEE